MTMKNLTADYLAGIAARGFLFAILDSTDQPLVISKVMEFGDRTAPLFSGTDQQNYWAVAPYLINVNTSLLEWIVSTLWEEPWGIFVLSDAPLDKLGSHFQKLLLVRLPDSEQVYFRFYDPRVLRVYLPTCSAEEATNFFGPVKYYVAADNDADALLIFQNTAHGLQTKTLNVTHHRATNGAIE